MTHAELEKMKKNPLAEVKRRIRKALSSKILISKTNIDFAIFNNYHCIKGVFNTDEYILEYKISKRMV